MFIKELNYLKLLNEKQVEALLNIKNPVFILAGAGTGKTRVITYKIFYLIESANYNIENILAVTFTNKASNEMKRRIYDLAHKYFPGKNFFAPWIRTFHSTCLNILMEHFSLVELKKNFTIYNTDDVHKLLQQIIKLDTKLSQLDINISKWVSKLSYYKNQVLYPQDIYQLAETKKDQNLYQFASVYEKYEEYLQINNAVDFDNLILKVIQIFRQNPSVLEYYQNQFKYVLVDEFQDINNAQYQFIELLTLGHQNITVVGDDDQSIYSWRGANVSNMNQFIKNYKNTVLVKLEENYRSPNLLLKAANGLIKHNHNRIGKELWSESLKAQPIKYYKAYNRSEEAEWIGNQIFHLKDKVKVQFSEIGVLYRINSQSRLLEESLRRKNIPYRIFGSVQFYERLEIKDILAFFNYLVNPLNELVLKRILKILDFGIGLKTIEKIDHIKKDQKFDLEASIIYGISNKLFRLNIIKRLENFLLLLKDLKSIDLNDSLVNILDHIFQKTNYLEYLKQYKEPETRFENVEEFRKSLQHYDNHKDNDKDNDNDNDEDNDNILMRYMRDIMLNQELNEKTDENNFVSLMTLHHSKGLAFNYVFIAGLVQGILPHHRINSGTKEALYEERRLFYVGITRTIKECFMSSFIKERNGFNDRYYPESSFIKEIDAQYIDFSESRNENHSFQEENNIYRSFKTQDHWIKNQLKKTESKNEQLVDGELLKKIASIDEISVGAIVYHKEFGYCEILSIQDNFSGTSLSVFIQKDKTKLILLFKYATIYIKK